MALLNPTFHEPGVRAGTALNWTLRSICGAQKLFGFGPSSVRPVEDFERWFGFETEMDLTTSVRAFFDGMVFGVESFEGWGVFTSELETSCVSVSFAGHPYWPIRMRTRSSPIAFDTSDSQYREDSPYNNQDFAAWDRAREDYRVVNLKGGDSVLRDTEHYLFRYWVASESKTVLIPNGLPVDMPEKHNPTLPMHPYIMEHGHDPVYNTMRPLMELKLNIAPTTPEMSAWERQGYGEGYCASGDCMRDVKAESRTLRLVTPPILQFLSGGF